MKDPTITACFLDPQQTNVADIIQRLDRRATIVTGNQRLTRTLHQIFDRVKISQGYQTWLAPDILPWNTWLQRLWQEAIISFGQKPVLLLSSHQERHIWWEIFWEYAGDFSLRVTNETVTRIMDAWQMLHAWHIPLQAADFDYNADSKLFWKLLQAFEARCQENGWLSFAALPKILQDCLQQNRVQWSDELVLLGFDELTPQQLSLLHAVARTGCRPQWLQLSGESARVGKIGCTEERSEIRLAACWIRQRLEANPATRIALVVPELATQREIVVQVLDEVLVPQALQPGQHDLMRPYNLSLGKPLNRFPLVGAALDILDLSEPIVELPHIGRLLRSSFIAGWEQEASARALLDACLRETGEWNVAIQTLLVYASRHGQAYSCPLLVQYWSDLVESIRMRPALASPGTWAQRFEQWLKMAGWPGSRTLSSEEYQVIQAWQSLLREFATLDWVTRPISLDMALDRLKQMMAGTVFQPESPAVPVQVLGLLETNGLQFDHIWITGLHDGVWPVPPRPNPFIPLPLQQRAGTPHSSAERELRVAKSLLQRITASANQVILSYPQRNGDEYLSPSPLIEIFPVLDEKISAVNPLETWLDSVYHSRRLVVRAQDPAPPFNEKTDVTGGSRLFKLQAACPFLAFAELRLGARPLGRAQIGLNARVRGSLLHRVMETIWADLDSSETLMAMSQDQLNELIANRVHEAIHEIAPRYPQTFGKRLQSLEFERLHRLTLAWLELEKYRPPFRVLNREKEAELNLSGLRVHLRIDRIDELVCGGKLLIDYKTGLVKPSQWFGERPDDPQLPLYSLVFADEPAGIAFAQIRTGDLTFKGVVREEECTMPGMSVFRRLEQTRDYESWSEILADWRQELEKLALSFLAGEAEADPKQYPLTCTHCALKPLCRIDELTACTMHTDYLDK